MHDPIDQSRVVDTSNHYLKNILYIYKVLHHKDTIVVTTSVSIASVSI